MGERALLCDQDREIAAAAVLLGGKISPEPRRNILRRLVGQVDLTLAAGEPRQQVRDGKVTRKTYPTWRPEQIVLRLAPMSCTPSGQNIQKLCPNRGRDWVSVEIVRAGALLPPAEALERAWEAA